MGAADQGHSFLLPPHSRFLLSDLACGLKPLIPQGLVDRRYDLIVMDPPILNASVGRGKQYGCLDPYELFVLPIRRLLAPGGILAIWLTNRGRIHRIFREKLLPAWGNLSLVGHWHWLKVTRSGLPVVPFHHGHRRPYEVLLLARAPMESSFSASQKGGSPLRETIPFHHVLVSVPSRQHSRKPRLQHILDPHLTLSQDSSPRRLELFSRSLTPGWTAWGNECLRFQDEQFYYPNPDHVQIERESS
ncbi:MT-A70-domain-containing protein [Piptocephalis cylindrospora]|uniref:MT-A70-domain-containing protein n=1 Tax=Piptocephalis cylindrospora TaxID=1907219 RepID=A0A4P9YAB2_9FUNG|nr:MT-A70-domain-containing protein [Piptocephalis cylindrospora]|eukprot:RKP15411.1 MT-A70-domain-containing protein [Piptocephalis cylindrospora]